MVINNPRHKQVLVCAAANTEHLYGAVSILSIVPTFSTLNGDDEDDGDSGKDSDCDDRGDGGSDSDVASFLDDDMKSLTSIDELNSADLLRT